MWNRNFFNSIAAITLCDDELANTSAPSNYTTPLRIRLADGSYINPSARKQKTSPNSQWERYWAGPYLGNVLRVGKDVCTLITNYNAISYNTGYYWGIGFGSGTADESYEDYRLSSLISSGLTLVAANGTLTQASTYNSETHKITAQREFVVNNSSGSNITINELGVFVLGCGDTNAGIPVLINRIKLNSPIILEPAQSIKIKVNREGIIPNYTPYPT